MTKFPLETSLLVAFSLLAARAAEAHVSVASGAATANATQEVVFGVGHGCAGADTFKVKIELPAGVTSVRPLRGDFGAVTVEKDTAGTLTAVTWQKADADLLAEDLLYYKLVLRLKTPNAPFTTIYFPAHQTCKAADGTVSVAEWVSLPTSAPVDGSTDEPAPALKLVPARLPGWNKVKVPVAISDLSVFFADAAIVWKGTAAYSANAAVKEQIAATAGVTALTALAPNDEIWVKY